MIRETPSLQRPLYAPTPWAKSSKANFILATARSRLGALRRKVEPPLAGLRGRTSDCGDPDISVEWCKDERGVALPVDAPICIFLHTITGSAAQTRWLMGQASRRGWRSCVFVRRGHGGGLSSPSFNLLGEVADVEAQLAAVRRTYPEALFLGMVGVSAGSGLLISYLGRAGASTPVGAACAICPAWDVEQAFAAMGSEQPLAEAAMLKQITATFVKRNEQLLRAWDSTAVDACLAAESLPEMLAAHAPFAMRARGATGAGYLAAHDPLADRHGIAVPILLLNAEDDFVCSIDLAQPDVVAEKAGALLLVTRSGSHVAFNEGLFGSRTFHTRASFDFLDAAFATATASSSTEATAKQARSTLLRGVVVPTASAQLPAIEEV